MNKDQIKGRVEQAVGKVKEVAGELTDNPKLKSEGNAQQVKGKVQSTYGDVKHDVAKQIDK